MLTQEECERIVERLGRYAHDMKNLAHGPADVEGAVWGVYFAVGPEMPFAADVEFRELAWQVLRWARQARDNRGKKFPFIQLPQPRSAP